MKFYAIVGSPRKKWNADQLTDSFIEGVRSVEPDAEIKKINVYDYDFKGCRSCFGCKLKTNETHECVIRDDIHDLLIDIRKCDGFVMASPIYFIDISGYLRAFLERLMYPGPVSKEIPISTIYTMNAGQEAFDKMIRPMVNIINAYFKQNFRTVVENEVLCFDTLQRKNNELYVPGKTDHEAKQKRHDVQFPIDLKNAYDAGVLFARKARRVKEANEA